MNKKYLSHLALVLILFLIQTAAIKVFFGSLHLVPQLLLLFAIIFALQNTLTETIWMSFVCGFFLEIFSGSFFGGYIFGFLAVGVAAYLITRNLTAREVSVMTAVLLVVLATILFPSAIYLYNRLAAALGLTAAVPFTAIYSLKLIWTALLNLVFYYPVLYLFKFLIR